MHLLQEYLFSEGRFVNGRAKGKSIQGHTDIADFVASIAAPRKIMMMVRAGSAVDELMDQLFPHLSAGDILIDGGNSNFEDTNRRVELAEKKGFRFVGAGVSGVDTRTNSPYSDSLSLWIQIFSLSCTYALTRRLILQ